MSYSESLCINLGTRRSPWAFYVMLPIWDLMARKEGDTDPSTHSPHARHRRVANVLWDDAGSAVRTQITKLTVNADAGPSALALLTLISTVRLRTERRMPVRHQFPRRFSTGCPRLGGDDCSFVVPLRSCLDQEPEVSIAGSVTFVCNRAARCGVR